MSSVDDAVTALVSLFSTVAPAAQIIDGPIEGVTIVEQQVVVVGDGEIPGIAEFDSMSTTTTTEDYIIPVVASVSIPGYNMQAAREARTALYETLKSAVLSNPSLGTGLGGSLQGFPTGEFRFQQLPTENGRNAAVRFGIKVMATNT
jgi:hypothetical protein